MSCSCDVFQSCSFPCPDLKPPEVEALVCWECRAVLLKFRRYRTQALRVQFLLQNRVEDWAERNCLSRLSLQSKSFYDAGFVFNEYSPDPSDAYATNSFDSEEVIPKIEVDVYSDCISNCGVWADPADGIVESTRTETPAVKSETRKMNSRPRGRPANSSSREKLEMFRATSAELFDYRQRAFKNLQIYSYTCVFCIVGFLTEDKLNKHNMKYHSEAAGAYVCDICSSRFPHTDALSRHRAAHYVMYRCRHVGCGFHHPSVTNVRNHCVTHVPRNKGQSSVASHQCDMCVKKFKTAQGLSVHRQTHTSDRTYECDHCGKTFRTRTQIHLHMPHHTLKLMCDVCGKRLPNERRLKMHALAHLDLSYRPHECDLCHKRFIDKYKLLIHTRHHSGEKPFKCQSCMTEYVSKEQLTQHLKKHHSIGSIPKVREFKPRTKSLYRNERIFPGKQQKRVRIKQENDTDLVTEKFQCNICGKRLSSNQNLQSHFGVHSNERPVKCDECDKTFKYRPQLYAHKLRHRGDKPHQCTICGTRFAFKTILITHLKSHSNEKQYKCDECDLTFKYNSGLWSHKLIHKGERPHQCSICGARFTLKGNLTGHMKTHTNDKPFECDLCGRKFPWRRSLKSHYKTHAKDQNALGLRMNESTADCVVSDPSNINLNRPAL